VSYLVLKWLHVVSATVLLGTGAGIAFFFWRVHRTHDARVISSVARDVVLADLLFTAVAVVVQPVTGWMMMKQVGFPLSLFWIYWSIALYVLVGVCWLPVVWLQWRMRDLAEEAVHKGAELPLVYFRYFRWWKALGWPAFAGVLGIVWLMVAKPGY
jgi:uncharacterized membrane protein